MCDYCKDTGYELVTVTDDFYPMGIDRAMPCTHCDVGKRRKYAGIPAMALDWTFDNYPEALGTKITVSGTAITIDMVRAAFVDRDKWIAMLGRVGTGKTSLAIAGYKLLRDAGKSGRYWNTGELLAATKDTWGKPDLVDPMAKLHRAYDVLVLDGLGESRLGNWDKDAISQLLGQRYAHRLRTIITSNWEGNEFVEELGGWIADRLRDSAIVMNFKGDSMRGRT